MVKAVINYVQKPQDGDVNFILDTDWSGADADPREVEISDARCFEKAPSLDREGFELCRIENWDVDYSDMTEIEKHWIPSAREQVMVATGATWATYWATNIRFSNRSDKSVSTSVSAPARKAHTDLTPIFMPSHVSQQPVAEQATAAYRERYGDGEPVQWRVVNLWQQISPPPQDTPLTLCNLQSVAAEDLLVGHGAFAPEQPPSFQLTFIKHNAAHQWCYFSNMAPGEAILFSGLNSQSGEIRGRTPHIAFDLPNPPENTIPRNSIEVRWLLTFD